MRARNIKPGFFENEYLAKLSPHARLLFIGLWCLADREGRLEYRPARIHGLIFPYEPQLRVADLLSELDKSTEGFITHYRIDERAYIQVNGFLDHQRPHPKEKNSTIPPFEGGCDPSREKVRQSHEITRPDPSDIRNVDTMNVEYPQTKPSKKSARQKTSVPESLAITSEMWVWAQEKHGITDATWLERETEKFLNYNRANGKMQVDWVATWRNWIIKALEYQAPKNNVQALPMGERYPGLSEQLKQVGG